MILVNLTSCLVANVYYETTFLVKSLRHNLFFTVDCLDSEGNPISGDPFEKENDCDHFYQVKTF